MLTLCGGNCRFMETYFITKDTLTPRANSFRLYKGKRRTSSDYFFYQLQVGLSLDNCQSDLSGLLKVPRAVLGVRINKNCHSHLCDDYPPNHISFYNMCYSPSVRKYHGGCVSEKTDIAR